MNFKAIYVLKQVSDVSTQKNLLHSTILGEYCRRDYLSLYKNVDTATKALNNITTEHIINDFAYTMIWDIYKTIIYVNRNKYFLVYTPYEKTVIPTGGLLGGPKQEANEGWFIFRDTQYSGVNAYILEKPGTPDILLGKNWTVDSTSNTYDIFDELKTYPDYPDIRTWTRFSPPCIRCPSVNTVCTKNPSQEQLNMRRKTQTLLHKNNSSNLSKKRILSNRIQQKGSSGKNYWATQNVIYTNPNTNNLVRVKNTLLINPSGFSLNSSTIENLTIADNIKDTIVGGYCLPVSNQELNNITNKISILKNKKIYLAYKNYKASYLLSIDKNSQNIPAAATNSAGTAAMHGGCCSCSTVRATHASRSKRSASAASTNTTKYGIIIYIESNGTPTVFATCTYNVTNSKYSSVFWHISPNILPETFIKLIDDNVCDNSCIVPSFPPTFSDVPGKGPNLKLDKNIPLTQYITRRTYKGTVNF